jgi:HNH endonuclease/AP2 domain
MKKIKLTLGKVALVDDADFEMLNKYKWYARKRNSTFYATRAYQKNRTNTGMHRIIMNTPKGMDTDHCDRDGLNNQRENLRVCSRSENLMNRSKFKNNTSGYKGVSWFEPSKKWQANIQFNSKQIHLGLFNTKELAYQAYIEACQKYHKKFAHY